MRVPKRDQTRAPRSPHALRVEAGLGKQEGNAGTLLVFSPRVLRMETLRPWEEGRPD